MARQSDFTPSACRGRALALGVVVTTLWKRRLTGSSSLLSSSSAILHIASKAHQNMQEEQHLLARNNRISLSDFSFNFNGYGDYECMLHFRFIKSDVLRMMAAVAWPAGKSCTSRNRYSTTTILVTCVVLRRLACPARWMDLEIIFGKRRPHLSEIYWEALEIMWQTHRNLMTTVDSSYVEERANDWAEAVYAKSNALPNCVGFIDGTVIGIARPKGNRRQRVVYNGQKRKHALKYQAVITPDGLILHVCGPIEGRRHDWTLYVRSGLDGILLTVMEVDGKRYCLYGDSGYNSRWFMEVPFQLSGLLTRPCQL